MLFTVFLIVAIWFLDLPLWLQIVLTVFGSLHALYQLANNMEDRDD